MLPSPNPPTRRLKQWWLRIMEQLIKVVHYIDALMTAPTNNTATKNHKCTNCGGNKHRGGESKCWELEDNAAKYPAWWSLCKKAWWCVGSFVNAEVQEKLIWKLERVIFDKSTQNSIYNSVSLYCCAPLSERYDDYKIAILNSSFTSTLKKLIVNTNLVHLPSNKAVKQQMDSSFKLH